MCSFKLYIIAKVVLIEFSIIVERFELNNKPPSVYFAFALRYFAAQPVILFLLVILLTTAPALTFFFLNIASKYTRNLTMNEEFKYGETKRILEKRLAGVEQAVKGKTQITYDEMEKYKMKITDAELWLKQYNKLYGRPSLLKNFVSLLVGPN